MIFIVPFRHHLHHSGGAMSQSDLVTISAAAVSVPKSGQGISVAASTRIM
eukprot:gene32728-42381_t